VLCACVCICCVVMRCVCSMCVCMYVCVFILVYLLLCICCGVCTCMHVHACTRCRQIWLCLYVDQQTYVYTMSVSKYVCVYVCVFSFRFISLFMFYVQVKDLFPLCRTDDVQAGFYVEVWMYVCTYVCVCVVISCLCMFVLFGIHVCLHAIAG